MGRQVFRQIICRLVCQYSDPLKSRLLLAACDALVRPYLCQRATYTGTPHIGKNQRLENRRPHRAAPHVADCIGDSGFALKPCCTRLSVLWRGPVHRQAARDRRANSPAHRSNLLLATHSRAWIRRTRCAERDCARSIAPEWTRRFLCSQT